MMIVSSREFRDHLKKYFDLVDQNEQIIVQRGKDKAYVIVYKVWGGIRYIGI